MTLGHVGEELHQLLLGDLPNNEMLVVTDHLRECEPCRQELVDVSLTHALLSSLSELLAPEFRTASHGADAYLAGSDLPRLAFLEGPAPHRGGRLGEGRVPSASRPPRGFEVPPGRADRAGSDRSPSVTCLPITAAAGSDEARVGPATVRRHRRRPGPASSPTRDHRGRRAIYRSGMVAVAVAVLVFAAIIGAGSLRQRQPSDGSQIVLATALEPLGAAPNATGTVTVRADGDVSIATSGLSAAPSGSYYEVWLVDPGTSKMLPLGVLPSLGVGRFSFPPGLWSKYGVDIRLQTAGARQSSPGTSVLTTVLPARHSATHRSTDPTRPKVPPRAHPKVHHPAPPPRQRHPRVHHPRIHHPVAGTPPGEGQPAVVRRLLAASERRLTPGQDFTVDTTSDAEAVDPASGLCRDSVGTCSLRAAIEVANALRTPITIRVPAGIYALRLGALVATDPGGVTIQGVSAALTVLTSEGQDDRVLVVREAALGPAASAGATVSLADLSLRGGTAPSTQAWAGDGGAILVANAGDLLELSRVTIADSTASSQGGGLFARGRVWATAARFEDDHAGSSGGAARFSGSMALITNSVFTGDSAGPAGPASSSGAGSPSGVASPSGASGGAIDDSDAALVLVYSSFTDDSVSATQSHARGGAMEIRGPAWLASDVFVDDRAAPMPAPGRSVTGEGGALSVRSGPVTVESSLFVNDTVQGGRALGGAIFNASALTVNSSRFWRNSVAAGLSTGSGRGAGGAVYDVAGLTVTGCSFSGNSSSGDGGALYDRGPATLVGSVFSGNRASASGGAIYDDASVTLTGSTLSHDVALLGGGIFVTGSLSTSGVAVVDNLAIGTGAAGGGVLVAGRVASAGRDSVELRKTTIAGNVAPAAAGIAEQMGTGRTVKITISRSVVSANDDASGAEQDCAAIGPAALSLVSAGGNVIGDTSCALASPTDRQGPTAQGYWLAASGGAIRACASAWYGSLAGTKLVAPVVAVEPSPGNEGYWEVTADGRVANFGSASWFGSPRGRLGHATVTGFAATLDGGGYWVVTSSGQVFNYGDAAYFGSAGGADIVGMAPSVDSRGYWLLGANGFVHAFGDAPRLGRRPAFVARALAATPDGQGYWVAAADGAVYAFGDASSYGGSATNDVVALLPSLDGRGYLLVNGRGDVFAHGDATWSKRTPTIPIAAAAT